MYERHQVENIYQIPLLPACTGNFAPLVVRYFGSNHYDHLFEVNGIHKTSHYQDVRFLELFGLVL